MCAILTGGQATAAAAEAATPTWALRAAAELAGAADFLRADGGGTWAGGPANHPDVFRLLYQLLLGLRAAARCGAPGDWAPQVAQQLGAAVEPLAELCLQPALGNLLAGAPDPPPPPPRCNAASGSAGNLLRWRAPLPVQTRCCSGRSAALWTSSPCWWWCAAPHSPPPPSTLPRHPVNTANLLAPPSRLPLCLSHPIPDHPRGHTCHAASPASTAA